MTNKLAPHLTVHRPVAADNHDVLALQNACDIADYGVPDTALEEINGLWQQADLAQDALLVRDGDQLVGYGIVTRDDPDIHVFDLDVYTDPRRADREVGNFLISTLQSRVMELLPADETATLVAYAAHVDQLHSGMLKRAGFDIVSFYLRMQIELDAAPDFPQWPAGLRIRPIDPEQDLSLTYEVVRAAFSDGTEDAFPPFEAWHRFMTRESFDPSLWYLLEANDGPVGTALCYDFDQYGWVRQLGVLPAWRRRGLGRKLLRHTFAEFYRRDRPVVALGVRADNERAYQLYEAVGMKRVRQFDRYEKRLP